MKTTPTLMTAALTAFLVSCENPADKTADAKTTDAVEVAPTSAEGTRYEFTDASTISFIGSKVTGSHDGGFREFSGHFVLADDQTVQGGQITIDMSSTWSDADKLTEHLKSEDFFFIAEHPESTFMVTKVEQAGDGYTISGNLMLRGVEKNISFPAKATQDGEQVKVEAEFDINRKDWGIVYAGKADDLIRDEVVIRFDLVAEPAM